ncbi:MAG: hypothetical protein JWN06_653 [Propionibacteriaceae bacterium]|jgi:hypothetical protein|nr:hypothetical protein [Propionibacteriaceae bacterium]
MDDTPAIRATTKMAATSALTCVKISNVTPEKQLPAPRVRRRPGCHHLEPVVEPANRPSAPGAVVAFDGGGWAIVGFENCHSGSWYPFPLDRVRTSPGTEDAAPWAARTIVALVWSQESMLAIG